MEKMLVVASLMMKGNWSKGVTKMKTNIAVLTFLICIVMVTTTVKAGDVNIVPNGDFSGGTFVGRGGNIMPLYWDNANNRIDGGWGAPADEDYNTGGYVVAEVNGTGTPSGGYAVVFHISTLSLAALGFPEGELPFLLYFSADINDLIPGGGGPGAILKVECYSDLAGLPANLIINPAEEKQIAVSGSTWANYRESFTIPVGTKSIKFVFGVSTGWGGPNAKISRFAFDNLRIGYFAWSMGTPALYPVPIIGAAANPANKVISWTNPVGTVNADVYLLESVTPIVNPDPWLNGTRIAHNITDQNVTASSIQANRYYYWVVDVNMGSYVVPGLVWDFQTIDSPPTVNAGADQYLVAKASPMTITLNATATDDHPPIASYAWTDITVPTDKDPLTTVTIVSPTTEDTNIILTNTEPNHAVTGYYQFTLTVTDSTGNIVSDNVVVGVYGTCAAAAIADPNDPYDGVGDFNGDCKVNFDDLALFVDKWLVCDSLRIPCP
jgi:hypothetical protein